MRCGEEAPRFVGEIQDRRGGSLGRARRLSRTVPRPPSVILQMIHQSMSRFSASSTCNPAAFGRAFWTADDECSREVDLWLQDSCTLANRLALGQIGSPAACTVHFACRSTSMACICSAWVFWGGLARARVAGATHTCGRRRLRAWSRECTHGVPGRKHQGVGVQRGTQLVG